MLSFPVHFFRLFLRQPGHVFLRHFNLDILKLSRYCFTTPSSPLYPLQLA